ncbi:MAG TPA: phosphatase PAP2 family protein [Bryobacteraceae bacterium]
MSTLSSVEPYNAWDRRRIAEVLAPAVLGFIVAAIVLVIAEFCIFHWLRSDTAHFDASVRAAVHAQASPALTKASKAITLLGKYPLPLFAVLLFFFLWSRGLRILAWFPLAAFVSAAVLLEIAKELARRVRPHPWFGIHTPTSWSFPSGHSLDSTTCYLVFAVVLMALVRHRLPRGFILAVAILLPLMIGFTRIYLGVHWPTDVLAGWIAGFCLAMGLVASQRRALKPA